MNIQGIPRPEHPFPQMMRREWANLNGTWEFAETDDSGDQSFLLPNPYPDKIVVPFCRESRLSGLERRGFTKNVWYRRTFDIPADWDLQRMLLHFGASDWKTSVWLNGQFLGEHVGGSSPFSFEITDTVAKSENVLIVHVFDDTTSGMQSLGKQCTELESHGCTYTRTTGIWQTVWIEGVGSSFISDLHFQPDVDRSMVRITAEIDGRTSGLTLFAKVLYDGRIVGDKKFEIDSNICSFDIELGEKYLWSPKDPALYDVEIMLIDGERNIENVRSYFGLRKVTIQDAAILINDEPIYQRLVLDQGFYPDGVWTAPTDDDLRHDIEISQAAGFNGARLHEKVFEPRFLYWADKLGYLVWGEYPNWGLDYKKPIDRAVIDEWVSVIRRDRNHPSIIGWCPFNETPPEAIHLQNTIVKITKMIDPSRPVIDSSGWAHGLDDPEVLDDHDYDQNPETFRRHWLDSFKPDVELPRYYTIKSSPRRPMPFFISEFGGIGWNVEEGWGYGIPESEEEFYARYKGLVDVLLDNRFMFGFCYTQLYDVEQEQNGIYTYERKPKLDISRIKAINSRQATYETNPPIHLSCQKRRWKELVGARQTSEPINNWRFTTSQPDDLWSKPDYDDSSWQKGSMPFGDKQCSKSIVNTEWSTGDIWLRNNFEGDFGDIGRAFLIAQSEGAAEVYLNGEKLAVLRSWVQNYCAIEITEILNKIAAIDNNLLAIHCKQGHLGNFADFAIIVEKST